MPTIEHWGETTPGSPAIISPKGTRSFAELDAAANRVARALRRRGVHAGDAVALVCGNRPEWAEVYYACQRAGLRLTPINWHLASEEIAYIIEDCEAKALIVDLETSRDAVEASLVVLPCHTRLAIGGAIDGFEDYDAATDAEPGTPIDDPAPGTTMLYTSGTTGRPKGVHRPMSASSSGSVNLGGYAPDGGDVHLCTGPLYHAAPMGFSLVLPLAFGAAVVLMERWDASDALRLIDAHRVTHTHMVPTMFHRMLQLPADERCARDVGSLRHVLHGAAPCPVPVKQQVIEWFGPVVWEYYAATEGVGSFVDSATWLERPGTVGRPLAEGHILVGDEDGNPVPPREIGTVYLRAPAKNRFSYFKDDSKTASSFRGDYFTLGDVGYLDEDGYLFLTDRSANLIISGGVNIYPAEVDAALLEHPSIADAATIGVPDDEWGESVLSVVELRDGVEPSDELAAELIEHCRSRIAHYKCPRRVEFIDVLPRQDNGKLYRGRLRELYRSAHTPDAAPRRGAPEGANR